MYTRATMMFALAVGALGCKSSMSAPSATVYDFEDSAGEMDFESVEETSLEVGLASRSRGFGRRSRRSDRAEQGREMAPAAGAPPPTTPSAPRGEPEPEPAVADDDDGPDRPRHIVYTASLQVSVFNLEDAKARAESLPGQYGGFVQNMAGNTFIMRIPSARLRAAMEQLGGLGVIENRTLNAQDVTEEYLDIETRIEVLEAMQKQMMGLLTKARTVEEALKVRQALDDITMELEVLKGRLRRLSDLVSLSTLTLTLRERGPHAASPSSNDPFPWVDELGVEATEWK